MEPPVEKARCPWCGESLPDPDAVSCPSCHAALALGPMATDAAKAPPPNPFGPAPTAGPTPKAPLPMDAPAAGSANPLGEGFAPDTGASPNPFGPASDLQSGSGHSAGDAAPSFSPFGAETEDEPFKPLSAAEPFNVAEPDHPQTSIGAFRPHSDDEPLSEPFSPGSSSEPAHSLFGSEPAIPAGFDLSPGGSDARASEIASHSPFGEETEEPIDVGGSPFGEDAEDSASGSSPFGGEAEEFGHSGPAPFGDEAEPAGGSPFGDEPSAHSTDEDGERTGQPDLTGTPFGLSGAEVEEDRLAAPQSVSTMDESAPGALSTAGGEERPAIPGPFDGGDEPVPGLAGQSAPAPHEEDAPAVDAGEAPIPPAAMANGGSGFTLPAEPGPFALSDLPAPSDSSNSPAATAPSDLPIPPVASDMEGTPPAAEAATGRSPFDLPHDPAGVPGGIPGQPPAAGGFDFDFGPAAALPILGGAMAAGAASGPAPSAAAFPAPSTPAVPVAPGDTGGKDQQGSKRTANDRMVAPPGSSSKAPLKLIIPLAILGLVLIAGGAYWMFGKGNGQASNITAGSPPPGGGQPPISYPPGSRTANGSYPGTGGPTGAGQRPSAGGPVAAAGTTAPEGAGHPVQIYWRSATADYLRQHPGLDSPVLRNASGSNGAMVRVDVENYGSKTITVRPRAFRLKVGTSALSPAKGILPDLLKNVAVPPKEAVQGWLFFNGEGIPSALTYGGSINANVSPSQYPNGAAGGR